MDISERPTFDEQRHAVLAAMAKAGVTVAEAIRNTRTVAAAWHVEISRWTAAWRQRGLTKAPGPHACTPDYDLRCTVTGCGLGPEEH